MLLVSGDTSIFFPFSMTTEWITLTTSACDASPCQASIGGPFVACFCPQSCFDKKISNFYGIFHTQPWVRHHLFYSKIQAIALGWIGSWHDDKRTLADVWQLKTIWRDINALLKVARHWGWYGPHVSLVEREFWPTRIQFNIGLSYMEMIVC